MGPISATCRCVLHGDCPGPRPILRSPLNDSDLRYCPGGSNGPFWKWISRTHKCPASVGSRKLLSVQPSTISLARQKAGVLSACPSFDDRSHVFLTFDDAFDCTDSMCSLHWDALDMLEWLDMRVTFFVLTHSFLNQNSKRVALEYFRRGHTLGSHTHTHVNAASESSSSRADIDTAHSELSRLVGEEIKNFRAPNVAFPKRDSRAFKYLTETLGYTLWTGVNGAGTDWKDFELPHENWDLYANKLQRLPFSSGPVVTLHDRPHSMRTLERDALRVCEVCSHCTFEALPRSGQCGEPFTERTPSRQIDGRALKYAHIVDRDKINTTKNVSLTKTNGTAVLRDSIRTIPSPHHSLLYTSFEFLAVLALMTCRIWGVRRRHVRRRLHANFPAFTPMKPDADMV